MKSHTLRTISILVFAILLSACRLPLSGTATQDIGLIFTQAAQTADALLTQSPPTAAPTQINTQAPPPVSTATNTPAPTDTPTLTTTPNQAVTPTAGACANLADFVSDVTVPDDTEMLAGQEFIKTWRLKNSGTCTWTDKYALVFVDGDPMNGTSPIPLTSSVTSGNTVDVSVTLKAPGTTGNYRGNWKLQDAAGIKFGTGRNADQPFFVKIKVVEGVSELNLGTPTWSDNLDDANHWYLLDTDNTKFTEGDGVLEMKSIHPGGGEEWGLSNRPSIKDFYLQATFITGDICSGLDRYGLLTRAPDPNAGYVFEFTCDGHYRLYTWDGENYKALQEWRSAASIKAGSDQTNVMGLWMEGDTIRLYANGFKIAEFTDSTYDEGELGLVIGSVNTENFTVSVDRVEYWELNP